MELSEEATIRSFRIVPSEDVRQVARDVAHYDCDVIISTGYRVKSQRGTQFPTAPPETQSFDS